MSLQDERNTDLAFDTYELKQSARKYGEIANSLRAMAKDLNAALNLLNLSGWTTPAGTAFNKMSQTNWEDNINKYANLLDTLKNILDEASRQYETLVKDHVDNIKLR